MTEGPLSILFIGGYLRIGSTLVERILARVDGFVTVGELRYIWTHGYRDDHRCGCGEPFSGCPFWTAVTDRAFGGRGSVPVERLIHLQRSIDRHWHIPETAGLRTRSFDTRLHEYRGAVRRVLDAVREESGARVIIDASKAASHGFVLAARHDVDLRVLHLVRDSRAVAHSWTRRKVKPEIHWAHQEMPRYPVVQSALEWDALNVAAGAMRFTRFPYTRIRYEDVAVDPSTALEAALADLGYGSIELDFIRDGQFTLGVDHTVAGNPFRFARGTVDVHLDREWEEKLFVGQRRLVTALTWPLLARYGYPLRAGDATAMSPKSTNGHHCASPR